MYCIILDSDDPCFNLAIEEVLLKKSTSEYLILGINRSSVIIGKHQSAHREVNTKFIFENNIPVIRRISGGGTVYHDNGNLNYTFIKNSEAGKYVDFIRHTRPVKEFLSSLGTEVVLEEKSNLKADGYKISGNAEHVHRNRVLHHGTLLFDASLDMLGKTIRKDTSCYSSRAVTSNPSPVINLKKKLRVFRDIYEFRSAMMSYFIENLPGAESYKINPTETKEAESLAATKYGTWGWNYAYGPEYQFANRWLSGGFHISCRISVAEGVISECKIEGPPELTRAGNELIGYPHMVNDLRAFFKDRNIDISEDEVFNFF